MPLGRGPELNLDESLTLASPVGNRVDRHDHLCFKLCGDGNEFYEWFNSVGQKTTLWQPFHDKDSGPLRLDVPALPCQVTLIFYIQELPEITVDGVPAGERIQIGRQLDGRQTWIIS